VDFLLFKVELERATRELQRYEEVKGTYTNVIIKQNQLLGSTLEKIKGYMEEIN
jgi:hypothetical protein